MIEHVQLVQGQIDTETIESIGQMKQLKILEFDDITDLTEEHVFELAKSFGSKLEKLQLRGSTAKNFNTDGLKMMLPFTMNLSLLTLKSQIKKINMQARQEFFKFYMNRKPSTKARLLIELTAKCHQVNVNEVTAVAFEVIRKTAIYCYHLSRATIEPSRIKVGLENCVYETQRVK